MKRTEILSEREIPERAGLIDFPTTRRCSNIIMEEATETSIALVSEQDLAKIADGLADTIWTCIETAVLHGIPLHRVWDEVARANLSKVDGSLGPIVRRGDGKILKPTGWTPPNIAGALYDPD